MANVAQVKRHTIILDDTRASVPSLVEVVVPENEHMMYDIDQFYSVRDGITTYRFLCKRNSRLHVQFLLSGGAKSTNRFEIILQQEGAHATIMGCVAGAGSAQQTVEILQRHEAAYGTSYSLVHAALTDQAAFNYEGSIIIGSHALGTDAALYNKNILLSDRARARAVPSLEVENNQVQCKHGTATSRCDEEQLLYMQSRGIDKVTAQELIVRGFFSHGFTFKPAQIQRVITQLLKGA